MFLTSATWLRGFVAMTMLVGLFGWTSVARAAPAADVAGNTYTSPQFGYSLTFGDSWFVVEETSEEMDSVTLTNGLTFAFLFGAEEAGGSAVLELAFFVAELRTDPAITNFEELEKVTAPERSYAVYSFTLTDESFSGQFTIYVETQTVIEGSTVLLFWTMTPSDFYDSESPAIRELAAGIEAKPIPCCEPTPEPTPEPSEPAPVFVSGQWRVAVRSASLNESFGDLRLKSKDGKEWLVVIADVTNWSSLDGEFAARDFTVQAGPDGQPVKAAPSSTKSVTKTLGFEPVTDDLTIAIPANQTRRVALVFAVPARSRELMLVRENARLPLADALSITLDPAALPARVLPAPVAEGEFVSASDGRTVRVQLDGKAKSTRMRLLGVEPPAENACYEKEAEKVLDDLTGQRVMVEEDAAIADGSTPVRYIWLVNADGTRTLINERLIADGLASVDNLPADARFGAWLRESERSAEAAPVGLWLDCASPTATATKEATKSPTPTPTKEATKASTVTSTKTTTADPTKTATKAPTKSATPTATEEDGDSGEVAAKTTHNVTMRDINYNVVELVVPANSEITINLTNAGIAAHTFNIDALDVHSGEYSFGQRGTLTFETEEPGTYVFYCSTPGHKQAGMTGTLIVVDEADS